MTTPTHRRNAPSTAVPAGRPMVALLTLGTLVTGCATARIDGQWSDPAFSARTLRDRTVLVTCRAPDGTLARACEAQLAQALREAGARPVLAERPVEAAGGGQAVAEAARNQGAAAAVSTTVSEAGVMSPTWGGPSLGIGIGGGFGGRGTAFGSIGLSVPLGGVRPRVAYGANTALIDPATAREMWSVRITHPATEDASVQMAELARLGVDAMRRSGLFEPR
jgi:hypothetical protein